MSKISTALIIVGVILFLAPLTSVINLSTITSTNPYSVFSIVTFSPAGTLTEPYLVGAGKSVVITATVWCRIGNEGGFISTQPITPQSVIVEIPSLNQAVQLEQKSFDPVSYTFVYSAVWVSPSNENDYLVRCLVYYFDNIDTSLDGYIRITNSVFTNVKGTLFVPDTPITFTTTDTSHPISADIYVVTNPTVQADNIKFYFYVGDKVYTSVGQQIDNKIGGTFNLNLDTSRNYTIAVKANYLEGGNWFTLDEKSFTVIFYNSHITSTTTTTTPISKIFGLNITMNDAIMSIVGLALLSTGLIVRAKDSIGRGS